MRYILYIITVLLMIQIAFAGYVDYGKVGSDIYYNPDNKFMSSTEDKITMIIPSLLIIVNLVCVFVDFGVIGVVSASIIALTILSVVGIIALSVTSVVAYVILGAILIFKLVA